MTDADGYFSPRDHPQEMVADPSLPQKVLDEEEAVALATAMAASVSGGNDPGNAGGNRRVMMGADEFVGGSRGAGGVDGVVGEAIGGDSPPRYTFAPDEAEMVADGYRGGMRMGGMGMGVGSYAGVGGMGGMGMNMGAMGAMGAMGMGLGMMDVGGMGHVPMSIPMQSIPIPEAIPMLQAPQAPQVPQVPQVPQAPQAPQAPQVSQMPSIPHPPPPPPLPQPFPFMQPLQAPQSMSDQSPATQNSEEPAYSRENNDLECGCHRQNWGWRSRRSRRRARRCEGRCGKKCRRRVMGVVWGIVFLMVAWGAWTMYNIFTHSGFRGAPWSNFRQPGPPENKYHCHDTVHSWVGQNIFRFPISSENATDTAPSFYLHQRPLNPSHPWRRSGGPRFTGEVLIKGYTPVEPEDEGMIKVQFDILMNRDWMDQTMKLEKGKDGQGVTIYTDYKPSKSYSIHPTPACASIGITVSIPRGTNHAKNNVKTINTLLKNMDIDIQSLCITVDPSSLDLVVDGETKLNSFCGDITFMGPRDKMPIDLGERDQLHWSSPPPPPAYQVETSYMPGAPASISAGLRSKSLKIKTLTGRILAVSMPEAPNNIQVGSTELETTSGNIQAAVIPQLASSENIYAANLTIKTISGNVLLDKPPSHYSQNFTNLRPTGTYIRTTTGRIFGEALLTAGSLLDVRTSSGDLDLFRVSVPAGIQKNPPILRTQTKSGKTAVRVMPAGPEPVFDEGEDDGDDDDDDDDDDLPLIVRGLHTSITGPISADYHSTWEGRFIGKSLNGEVHTYGKGLKVVPFNEKFEESIRWNDLSSSSASSSILGEDIPTPDPAIWTVVYARRGPRKGLGGMVELQSISGSLKFEAVGLTGLRAMLNAAKETAKELLTKVGCDWWNEKRKPEMVSVGVQTDSIEEDKVKEEEGKDAEDSALKGIEEEGEQEEEKSKGATLVETEKGMGKPMEIEDDDEEGFSEGILEGKRRRRRTKRKVIKRRRSDL